MPLPKIDLPIYDLKIVSLPDPIKFRPFLVKEEKLLLMALQDGKEEEVLKTIKQVINNCLISELDVDSLPIFDIEYLFLNLRARSVGEKVETYFTCRAVVGKKTNEDGTEEDELCMHLMPVEVNLLDIQPPKRELESRIYLTQNIGIQLKYPTFKNYRSIESLTLDNNAEELFKLILDCTDYIFDENGVYYVKEQSFEELVKFLEGLTQEQFDKITNFFESLPTIELNIKSTCSKCNFTHEIHMEGLTDFFT